MGLLNVSQKDAFATSKNLEDGTQGRQPDKKDLQLDLAEKYQNKALSRERLLASGTIHALQNY